MHLSDLPRTRTGALDATQLPSLMDTGSHGAGSVLLLHLRLGEKVPALSSLAGMDGGRHTAVRELFSQDCRSMLETDVLDDSRADGL